MLLIFAYALRFAIIEGWVGGLLVRIALLGWERGFGVVMEIRILWGGSLMGEGRSGGLIMALFSFLMVVVLNGGRVCLCAIALFIH